MKIIWKATRETRGGCICFSVVVNALSEESGGQNASTESNLNKMSMTIAEICRKYAVSGYSLISQSGQYFSPEGKTYHEDSYRMEMIGITTRQLEGVAECLCREFCQRSVLINNYNTTEIYRITSQNN